jgi:hypothetical protein
MLTDGDRSWLQGNFDRIHDRINKGESSLYHAKEEMQLKLELARKEHEDKFHNPLKTWGILGGIAAVVAVIIEAIKWLVKKGA